MRTYVIRRLLLFIPSLFILSMLVFFTVRLLPGDAADLLAHRQEFAAVEIDKERLREIMGLDVPAHIQYVRWMSGILLRGTLGQSLLRGHTPVEEKILGRVPVTLELGAAALSIGLLIALPVGIYSAVRQDTPGRLCRAQRCHLRAGHSQLLAGPHGPHLSQRLVGLGATAPTGSRRRGCAGPHRHVHHPRPHPRHLPVRRHHADDAYHDAGGAAAGLRADGVGQGPTRAGGSSSVTR